MVEIIIKPNKGFFNLDLKEIWHFRELFYFLSWRDVKVRYKQTLIGIAWAVLQPFLTMIIFSIFFGKLAGISSGEIPYPIFVYSGLLFWNYFANSLLTASNSLIAEQNVIQKVHFPRIIIPLASTFVFLLDFVFSFIVFVGLMFYYHFFPTLTGLLLIIPSLLITFFGISGLSLVFSAINVKYRDVRYALPFFIQLLLFLTPVIYPVSILGKYQWLLYLNPISGVIETIRTGLLGVGTINWFAFGFSALISIVLFFLGILYFKKSERFFADII
ncbi:ABC transporter permease [Patescibacteria group bacterium]|nr:ABC transporter permease [Patescibacteria group bacterium]